MSKIIKTKYGNASINNRGYYVISSYKEGNHGKFLHRLIWEDYYNCKLDKNDVIHHADFNKTNNHISNLVCMSRGDHYYLHNKGRTLSEKHKQKISEACNNSGYFRVTKQKTKRCKQGFIWRYQYYGEDGIQKKISAVDIEKLESKVKALGLKWYKFEKND